MPFMNEKKAFRLQIRLTYSILLLETNRSATIAWALMVMVSQELKFQGSSWWWAKRDGPQV